MTQLRALNTTTSSAGEYTRIAGHRLVGVSIKTTLRGAAMQPPGVEEAHLVGSVTHARSVTLAFVIQADTASGARIAINDVVNALSAATSIEYTPPGMWTADSTTFPLADATSPTVDLGPWWWLAVARVARGAVRPFVRGNQRAWLASITIEAAFPALTTEKAERVSRYVTAGKVRV